MTDFDRALEHLLCGDATLFLGAGFSLGAENVRGEPFKSAKQLAVHLSRLAEIPEDTPLDDASEEFAAKNGEDNLITELHQEYTVSKLGDSHVEIAKLPWRRVFTCNYDNVLETAYSQNLRHLTPVTSQDRIIDIPKTDTISVHLNGYIDRLTRESLWSEFKLTDTSYASESLLDSPWMVLFRQDLRLSRAVFFLGYSLGDLDIKRLLYDTPELSAKSYFILGKTPDHQTVRRASKFGKVMPLDVAGFAGTVTRKRKVYSPPDALERLGVSITRFAPASASAPFSDRSVLDLLLLGNVEPAFVWEALHKGPRYYLERPTVTSLLGRLQQPGTVAVLHADLGNGKTLLLEGVKARAHEQGYSVFTVSTRSEDLFDELRELVQVPGKILIIIDDYPAWLDVIGFLGMHARPEIPLLLSSRSSLHDVTIERMSSLLEGRRITEYPVDTLTDTDIGWVVDLFDEYGLWGENAAWSLPRKVSHLKKACDAQFHAALLDVLRSPAILSRFAAVLKEIEAQRGYHEVILSILVLTMLNFSPTVDTLVDLWGDRVLDNQFRKNTAVKELLDVRQGKVLLRSSVAAEAILKRATDAQQVVNVLISIARTADQASRTSALYWEMLRELTRFSSLQMLLPEAQRRPAVIRYYENTKSLGACARNPHFWLQYAIACLVLEDFERTERYFKTAYSLADRKDNYNTFMFDTHFARFLLLRAIRGKDPVGPMNGFREARRMLNNQLKLQRLHYPYRVAVLYGDFYDAFESSLSNEHRKEVARAAKYVADQAARLPEERRQNRHVAECEGTMKRILERTGLEGPPPAGPI